MAKRESRASKHERLLREAKQVEIPTYCDVFVVGGGASGLAAAIMAAEDGASVVVVDRDLECGRSILATGNGRCNFANVRLDPRRYNNPEFVRDVCGSHWLDDVLSFFRECGLRWSLEDDRLYPMSRQAASVRNVLLARARKAGVILAPAREFQDANWIKPESCSGPYGLMHYDPSISTTPPVGVAEVALASPWDKAPALPRARAVVIATGGVADFSLGHLGLTATPRVPVLCPLACEQSPLSVLDGRRAHAQVSLTKADSFFPSWQERGEVLFRNYGISGIVTFDLSRRAAHGDLAEVNLAPDLNESQLRQLIDPFAGGSFEPGCLDGILDPVIATILEDLARKRWHIEWPERKTPRSDSDVLISLVRSLPFVVDGPIETEHAQVMRGGMLTSQFDPSTLASHEHPWLFACGEALDIDADCGGFNLSWAWKSGMIAGASAARWARS